MNRIECYLFTEQYAGSTKATFRSKANNHKSTHRNFMSKKEKPRQALKQKTFMNISVQKILVITYYSIEDWVIYLIERTDLFKKSSEKELRCMYR